MRGTNRPDNPGERFGRHLAALACLFAMVAGSARAALVLDVPAEELAAGRIAPLRATIDAKDFASAARLFAEQAGLPDSPVAGEELSVSRHELARRLVTGGGEALTRAVAAAAMVGVEPPPDAGLLELIATARRALPHRQGAEALKLAAGVAHARADAEALADIAAWALESGVMLPDALTAAVRPVGAAPGSSVLNLPFDARWYGTYFDWSNPRVMPATANGVIYVVFDREVAALRESGQLLWTVSLPKPKTEQQVLRRTHHTGRGPALPPALLLNTSGEARVVVVRHGSAQDGELAISALRASDGARLWSTDSASERRLIYLSPPSLRGSLVYLVALSIEGAREGAAGKLLTLALDLGSGREVWRRELGDLLEARRSRDPAVRARANALDLCWELSPPVAHGRLLLLAPNVGQMYALDRFTGDIVWRRPYRHPPLVVDAASLRKALEKPENRDAAGMAESFLLRWHGAPVGEGSTAVFAPQDSAWVYAVDVTTGELRWESSTVPSATPVGSVAGRVVFAGRTAAALDTVTGKHVWTWAPPAGSYLTGPAAVLEGVLLFWVNRGPQALSADAGGDGRWPRSVSNWRAFANSAGGRRALDALRVRDGLQPAPPAPAQ